MGLRTLDIELKLHYTVYMTKSNVLYKLNSEEQISEVLMLAKLGQPFYTQHGGGSKYKYTFSNGTWFYGRKIMDKSDYTGYPSTLDSVMEFLKAEQLISEQEYDSE